jgi:hypothetical protein
VFLQHWITFFFFKWRCKGDEVIPASGDRRCCSWRPKMLAALMMIIAYCFLWSSFCDHLSVLSFLISQQLLNLQRRFGLAVSVLWLNPGFFFVCRSEDNFKDNSPHCVLPSCSLFLSVFGFVLCFLCFFFCS